MFNLYNFIFQRLIWNLIIETWNLSSCNLIIELSRNEKLQKYRIILSPHTNYLHKWLVNLHFDKFPAVVFFFSERFLSMCKPRTTFYLFEGLAHLDGDFMDVGQHTYGAAWGWWIRFSSVPWDQKFSCRWNLSFFKAIPLKRTPFFPPYNQLLIQPVLLVPECYFA